MRPSLNGDSTSPEALLLGRIQQELAEISEQQHIMARRIATLRHARTQLHLGRSAPAVNALLAEHTRKELAGGRATWLERAGHHPADVADAGTWDLEAHFELPDPSYRRNGT